MKKHFIIPMALLATTMPIAALLNTQTHVETNPTNINVERKNISKNIINAKTQLISSGTIIGNQLSALKTLEVDDDVWIIIPNIEKIHLNDPNLSLNPSGDDDKYEVGMKIDANTILTKTRELDDDHNKTWPPTESIQTFAKPLYLNYDTSIDKTPNFLWSNNKTPIDKASGEGEEDWIYDLSAITSFLKKDYTFQNSDDVVNDFQIYWNIVSPFIVEGDISWDQPEDGRWYDYDMEWDTIESYSNKISIYAQRYVGTPTTSKDLISDSYLIAENTFSTFETEEPGIIDSALPTGAIVGIAVIAIVAIGALGWTTVWFFKPDKEITPKN